MSYKKVLKLLEDNNYIDRKRLFCYSLANLSIPNFVIVTKRSFTTRQGLLPRVMIISLQEDKINILRASLFGKPKEFITSIELKRMNYVGSFSKNLIDVYEFSIDFGAQKPTKFFIQGTYKKDLMQEVAYAIKDYGNQYER